MERTLVANLSKTFWWPRMSKTVKQYCKLCATCQRLKARTSKPPGSLYPLPKSTRPWETMSMDSNRAYGYLLPMDMITLQRLLIHSPNTHTLCHAPQKQTRRSCPEYISIVYLGYMAYLNVLYQIETLYSLPHFGKI